MLALSVLATVLILLGVAAELGFLAGSGLWPVADLPPQLSALWVPLAGGVAFLLGVLLAGRGSQGRAYAGREVILVLSGGASVALGFAGVLAVARSWPPASVVGLLGAGALEGLIALVLSLRILTQGDRRPVLFAFGGLLGLVGAGFHGLVLVLSLA